MLYMVQRIVLTLFDFYAGLILIYVLMSWIPNMSGWVATAYNALARLCEPYLGLFRRIIPPIGMVDISPVVAIIALQVVARIVAMVL